MKLELKVELDKVLSCFRHSLTSILKISKSALTNTDVMIIGEGRISYIQYSEDTTIVAEKYEDLQDILNKIYMEKTR